MVDTIGQSFRIEPWARCVIWTQPGYPIAPNTTKNEREGRRRKKKSWKTDLYKSGKSERPYLCYTPLSLCSWRDSIRFSRGRGIGYTSTLSCHVVVLIERDGWIDSEGEREISSSRKKKKKKITKNSSWRRMNHVKVEFRNDDGGSKRKRFSISKPPQHTTTFFQFVISNYWPC